MQEIKIKTHLIVTDVHDEFNIKWCGKIVDTNPVLQNGLPVFILISSESRVEMNTINMKHIENCAKRLTRPKGRSAVSTDKTYIYIKEVSGKDTLIGVVTHNRIKSFAPMYDSVGYK